MEVVVNKHSREYPIEINLKLLSDLDADIEMEWDSFNKHLTEYGEESEDVVWLNWNSFADVARYFYELGLKAK